MADDNCFISFALHQNCLQFVHEQVHLGFADEFGDSVQESVLLYLIFSKLFAVPDHVVNGLVEELDREQFLDQTVVAEHGRLELPHHLESSDQLHLVGQVFVDHRQNRQDVVLVGRDLEELSVDEEQVLNKLYPERKPEPWDFFDQHSHD